MRTKKIVHALAVAALFAPSVASAETKDEWITLGARIDGAFEPFIPVGIRMGLDAKERLHADPRGLTATYYNGTKPHCPCVADGVMDRCSGESGPRLAEILPEKAPDGLMAVIVIENRKTGEGLRYSISDEWLPKILAWIKSDPPARHESALGAEGLYQVEEIK